MMTWSVSTYKELEKPLHMAGERCLYISYEESDVRFEVYVPKEGNDLPAFVRTLRLIREP